MPAITTQALINAGLDVAHIAELATSSSPTAVDRLGNVKSTVKGAVDSLKAFNSRGTWAPETVYALKDLVSDGDAWHACVEPHTSSAAFATDAMKWRVHQGVTSADLAGESASTLVGHGPRTVSDALHMASIPRFIQFAHRGAHLSNLENTMQAFSQAVVLGAGGIETDVQPSADGTFYLFHHTVVDGVTNGTGTFTSLTDAYIDGLTFTLAAGTRFAGMKIPKLSELLTFMQENPNIYLLPEMTQAWPAGTVQSFVNLVKSYRLGSRVFLYSSDVSYLDQARSQNSEMPIAIIKTGTFATMQQWIDKAATYKRGYIAMSFTDLIPEAAAIRDYCDAKGVGLFAYTSQRQSVARDMLRSYVDGIISDIIFSGGKQ